MDQLKLKKWIKDFNVKAGRLQIEFDSFFQDSELDDSYSLEIDKVTQNLSLKITNRDLPENIKEQLIKILLDTKPEDSI